MTNVTATGSKPGLTDEKKRNAILPIFVTVFIDLIGFSILIPVFPLLINNTSFRVTPAGWSPRDGLVMLGWLQAVYPLCTFVAAPILGQLSDRFGRRPVLALSIAGTAIGYAIFAMGISAKAIPLLFLGRAIDGLTGGNIAVAQAAIGDVSDDSNRGEELRGARCSVRARIHHRPLPRGAVEVRRTAVSTASSLRRHGSRPRRRSGLRVCCASSTAYWCSRVFPETIRHKDPNKRIALATAGRNVVNGFTSERLRVPLLTSFLFNAGFTFFTTFFGVYLARKFGFTQASTGDYFAIIGLAIAVMQALVVAQVARHYVDYVVLRYSFFGLSIGMAAYFLATATWQLYTPSFLCSPSSTASVSPTNRASSRAPPIPGRQGEAMGISSSVTNLAQVPASVPRGVHHRFCYLQYTARGRLCLHRSSGHSVCPPCSGPRSSPIRLPSNRRRHKFTEAYPGVVALHTFEAEVWKYPGESAWHFLTLPMELADELRELTDGQRKGFGSVRVVATIGSSTWATSVFPDKRSGSYVLPVKKSVRKAEDLDDGATAVVKIELE